MIDHIIIQSENYFTICLRNWNSLFYLFEFLQLIVQILPICLVYEVIRDKSNKSNRQKRKMQKIALIVNILFSSISWKILLTYYVTP